LREQIRELTQERDRLHEKLNRLEDGNYVAQFNLRSLEVHEWARGKGWWFERDSLAKAAWEMGGNDLNRFSNSVIQSSLIALIHSELSEALEAIRHGNPPDDKIPEFTGLEAELADTVIRIHDMAGAYKLRVGEAIEAKMAFNHTREHKHGGKVV
jgi:NTP pyrophosphatase (non-canonical NTP hydrolase)